jgi:hypothetical protein
VEHITDLNAAPDEVRTRGVNVRYDQLQTLSGARLGCGEALPECDRATRVRWRQLDRPDVVAQDEIGVQSPSEALIEAFRSIDIGDGQRHDL